MHSRLEGSGETAGDTSPEVGRGVHVIHNVGTAAEDVVWKKSAHMLGLNSIRRHILSLTETKHRYTSTYFRNVVWVTFFLGGSVLVTKWYFP